MPTYEYKREDGTTFEIIQKMSEPALTKCPTTGQKVKRVITGGGGVVYKGDGWYVTDYKNKGKKSASTPPANTSENSTNQAATDGSKNGTDQSKTSAQ